MLASTTILKVWWVAGWYFYLSGPLNTGLLHTGILTSFSTLQIYETFFIYPNDFSFIFFGCGRQNRTIVDLAYETGGKPTSSPRFIMIQIYETFFIYPNDFSFIFVEMQGFEPWSKELTNMFHSQAYSIFLNWKNIEFLFCHCYSQMWKIHFNR